MSGTSDPIATAGRVLELAAELRSRGRHEAASELRRTVTRNDPALFGLVYLSRHLTDPETEQVLGFRPVLVLAGADSAQTLAAERGKREWTVWILLALFLFVVVESGWAWFCGKAW